MKRLQVRLDRFLLGLHGLALLRGWPFADNEDAGARMMTMKRVLERRAPDPIEMAAVELLEAYAAWSDTYDGPNPLIQAEEPVMRGYMADIAPGRALDVGCGTGRLARLLAKAGHDVVAVDASPEMLARAKDKGIRASFVQGDARSLPLADAAVDLVVCGLALTHVADLSAPIKEIARVVRPGGWAILSDIHPLAVATGAHAFFAGADGGRAVTRNELHWVSTYFEAFREAEFEVTTCAEPQYEPVFADEISDPELREAALSALPGLPFVLVWLLRRG